MCYPTFNRNLLFLALIANTSQNENNLTRLEVLQKIVSCAVGSSAKGGAFNLNGHTRKMLVGNGIYNVSDYVGIAKCVMLVLR